MLKTSIAIALIAYAHSFAETKITFSKSVEAFKQQGINRSHRSGVDLKRNKERFQQKPTNTNYDGIYLSDFSVDTLNQDENLADATAKIEKLGFKSKRNAYQARYERTTQAKTSKYIIDDTSKIDNIADNLTRDLLPPRLRSQIDLNNYSIEYTQKGIDAPKKTGYTYYFDRIYKGRKVRDSENQITINADSNGTIISIDLSWQKFKDEVSSKKYVNYDLISDSTLAYEASATSATNGVDTIPITEVTVTGMSDSWCKTSENKFVPCATYKIESITPSGQRIVGIRDIPIAKQGE